jgi:hypothetical protein
MAKTEVAGRMYRSKDALLEDLRTILYRYEPVATVDLEDSLFLTACLEQANRYYDYPIENPIVWQIRWQAIGRYPEFVFERFDGSRENPSIKRLSMQKPKSGKSIKSAARQSIAEQIKQFRNAHYVCEGYEGYECTGPFEVHHDEISFNEIWELYVRAAHSDEFKPGIVETLDETGIMLSYRLTEPYHSEFNAFHRQHAKLKFLCAECHSRITYRR